MEQVTKKSKLKYFILLHAIIFLYSIYAVLCKYSAQYPFLSFEFFLYYGLALLLLFIYAILWQVILKKLSLSMAFSNKAVTIIWGMLWGSLLFNEHVTLPKLGGAALVIAGIVLVVHDGE